MGKRTAVLSEGTASLLLTEGLVAAIIVYYGSQVLLGRIRKPYIDYKHTNEIGCIRSIESQYLLQETCYIVLHLITNATMSVILSLF